MKIYTQYLFWVVAVIVLLSITNIFQDVLLPFVIGGAIAYLLNPLVSFLIRKGMGRSMAVVTILGIFFVILMGGVLIIAPVLFHEASGLISAIPVYIEKLRGLTVTHSVWIREHVGDDMTGQLQTALQDNAQQVLSVGKNVVLGITSGGRVFIHMVTVMLIAPIAAYYFMKEWPRVTAWVSDLIPRQHIGTVTILLHKIDAKISGFVRGQTSVCVALGVVYAIALSLAGLQYGFVVGLVAGLLSVIPFVGSTIGLLTSITIAYFQTSGDWSYIGVVAGIFFVGQFIEGNFIAPKLMGDSVGMHPLWIIFALMAGGSLMGLMGMFLAVPVAASIGVLVGFALDEYKKSRYFQAV